jgi:hypothetical protein
MSAVEKITVEKQPLSLVCVTSFGKKNGQNFPRLNTSAGDTTLNKN